MPDFHFFTDVNRTIQVIYLKENKHLPSRIIDIRNADPCPKFIVPSQQFAKDPLLSLAGGTSTCVICDGSVTVLQLNQRKRPNTRLVNIPNPSVDNRIAPGSIFYL